MRTIRITTTFTSHSNDVVLQPTAPLWFMWNSGKKEIMVNDVYRLRYSNFWGIDTTLLHQLRLKRFLQGKKNFNIAYDHQYKIHFTDDTFFANSTLQDKQLILVQTNFTFK